MKLQNQDEGWRQMRQPRPMLGGGSAPAAPVTPAAPPTPPTPPTAPPTSNSQTTDQQQADSQRIVAAQGLQSTILTGSNTDTTQGVQKKTLLGG